jgi:hypothetical protein
MTLQYEFDTMDKLQEAMKHLEDYHDCDKCHGKIVGIGVNKTGQTICMYCKEVVRYPKMKREAFEKWCRNEDRSEGEKK